MSVGSLGNEKKMHNEGKRRASEEVSRGGGATLKVAQKYSDFYKTELSPYAEPVPRIYAGPQSAQQKKKSLKKTSSLSDEVKRLSEERESQAAELAQLREELRIAQEEKEERQREVERLQIEKQQQEEKELAEAAEKARLEMEARLREQEREEAEIAERMLQESADQQVHQIGTDNISQLHQSQQPHMSQQDKNPRSPQRKRINWFRKRQTDQAHSQTSHGNIRSRLCSIM